LQYPAVGRVPMRLTDVARGAHAISAMNLRETTCYDWHGRWEKEVEEDPCQR